MKSLNTFGKGSYEDSRGIPVGWSRLNVGGDRLCFG